MTKLTYQQTPPISFKLLRNRINKNSVVQRELNKWNVNPLRFIHVKVESKGAENVAHSNRFNAKDRVILNYENIKERDENPEERWL